MSNDLQVKISADTAELEQELTNAADKVRAVFGTILSAKVLAMVCAASLIALIALGTAMGVLTIRQHKQLATTQAVSASKDAQIAAAQKRLDAREADWKKQESAYEKQIAAITSLKDALAVLNKKPQISGQIAEVAPAQLAPEIRATLPDAPSYAVLTQKAAVDLGQDSIRLDQCNAALTKCAQDKADIAGQKITALADRDNWRNQAQGGSKSRRLLHFIFAGSCGAGGAAIGSVANGSKGAALGAGIGFAGCALLSK